MKRVLVRFTVLALLLSLFCSPVVAQNNGSSTIYKQVTALQSKHKGEKGVLSWACHDGLGLQTVKTMLRKEFGAEFTNAIKSFAILIYKDSSVENRSKIVSDISQITSILQEINIKDKMKKGERARGYVRLADGGKKISDLLIVVEAPAPKLIYIGGDFAPEYPQMKR